jgi:hypothetical protein
MPTRRRTTNVRVRVTPARVLVGLRLVAHESLLDGVGLVLLCHPLHQRLARHDGYVVVGSVADLGESLLLGVVNHGRQIRRVGRLIWYVVGHRSRGLVRIIVHWRRVHDLLLLNFHGRSRRWRVLLVAPVVLT